MSQYERLAKVSIEDLVSHVEATGGKPMLVSGEEVRVGSLRMRTFREKGHVCSCCGLEASFYAVERHKRRAENTNTYHFNLWGVNSNGHEVLFTHDHTLARSLGGKDHISNTTTMCSPCNNKKGAQEQLAFEAQKHGVSTNVWLSNRRKILNLPSKAEKKAAKREEILERLRTDQEYRETVGFHQRRLGKNDYPEIFGRL